MHPANAMKTILQSQRGEGATLGALMRPKNFKMLSRGAGAQFLLSAVNFAVLESVRRAADTLVADREIFGVILDKRFGAGIDRMMITAGAVRGLASTGGIGGFYSQ